ncbi:uncharacterized protein LOC100890012 isoform X2 [Strongylocentrotus purpuratus]|uniref:Uncharacterized protein n=1 Tax=Strongylocentrotus purpuratus TaxID=7668 RepID=A0A7M7PKD4_STRPU|nr:uncharacterized protein LOC100890012 isoform X2 [Strongylocentrotus purpuratus]
MSYFWSLAFLAVLPLVMAYPSGAPINACVNLTPGHRYSASVIIPPQTGPSPYSLSVSKNMYTPSEVLTVSVTGRSFRGILLQARLADDTLVGTFSDPPTNTKLLQCTDPGDSVTHTSYAHKEAGTSFTWTAPSSDVGNVIFTATFLLEYNEFWVKVTSQEIMASTDFINEPLCGSDGEDFHYYANIFEMLVANARLAPNSLCDTVPFTDDPSVISDRCVPDGTVICNGPRCDMRVTIDYVPDTDSYDVTINTPIGMDEWTGIGFSRNGAMIGSDAILVWINGYNGMIQVKDYQLNGRYTGAVVEDSNSDGLTFQEMHYQEGILNVRFNRLRNTGDSNDFVFTDEDSGCARLLLPKPGDGFGSVRNGVVQYHGRTPMVTSSICIRPCINGGWSDWTEWGACQARVCRKKGHRFRNRSCSNPEPLHGGSYCEGASSESEKCKKADCPVHGGWSAWRDSTPCSSTCGYSTRNQIRTCDNPAPARRGRHCIGPSSKTIRCRVPASCPRQIGDFDSFLSSYIPTTAAIPEVVIPEDSQWSSFGSVEVESPRSGPEVVDSWNSEGGDQGHSFSSLNEVSTTTENEQPIVPVPQIYEDSPSLSSLVPQPGQSIFSSDTDSSIPRSEVIQTTAKAPEESAFSFVDSSFESHVPPIEVIQTTAEIYEASPSWSSLIEPPEESPFSFVESSSFEFHVRPIEVIQTTTKAPEESTVPMFEDLARLIGVIQTPAEVENHSGLISAGGNGNITYENVPYTISKQLIHVDSSGGHTRISTA